MGCRRVPGKEGPDTLTCRGHVAGTAVARTSLRRTCIRGRDQADGQGLEVAATTTTDEGRSRALPHSGPSPEVPVTGDEWDEWRWTKSASLTEGAEEME